MVECVKERDDAAYDTQCAAVDDGRRRVDAPRPPFGPHNDDDASRCEFDKRRRLNPDLHEKRKKLWHLGWASA